MSKVIDKRMLDHLAEKAQEGPLVPPSFKRSLLGVVLVVAIGLTFQLGFCFGRSHEKKVQSVQETASPLEENFQEPRVIYRFYIRKSFAPPNQYHENPHYKTLPYYGPEREPRETPI
jgi:hypothetical protein